MDEMQVTSSVSSGDDYYFDEISDGSDVDD